MTRCGKLIGRLKSKPSDFTWDELVRLLASLGFDEVRPGKSGGSRRRFSHPTGLVISLHQPHPSNVLKRYAVSEVLKVLTEARMV